MVYHHEYLCGTKGAAGLPDVDDLIFGSAAEESQR